MNARSLATTTWSSAEGEEDTVPNSNYDGLPAAASFEQSIVLAQLIILRDLERRAEQIRQEAEKPGPDLRAA
jgi:hypothetical protein